MFHEELTLQEGRFVSIECWNCQKLTLEGKQLIYVL